MSYFSRSACRCGATAGEACRDSSGRPMDSSFHASRHFDAVEIVRRELEIVAEDVLMEKRRDD